MVELQKVFSFLIFQKGRHLSPFLVSQPSSKVLIKEGPKITPQVKRQCRVGAIVMLKLIVFLFIINKEKLKGML